MTTGAAVRVTVVCPVLVQADDGRYVPSATVAERVKIVVLDEPCDTPGLRYSCTFHPPVVSGGVSVMVSTHLLMVVVATRVTTIARVSVSLSAGQAAPPLDAGVTTVRVRVRSSVVGLIADHADHADQVDTTQSTGGKACVNVAVTDFALVISTLHGAPSLHAPPHLPNVQPLAGVAVNWTVVPEAKLAEHVPLVQVRPLGTLVIVPEPVTVADRVSV